MKNKIRLFPKDADIMTKWAVGIDIEELDKVRKAISSKRFVLRTFTRKEIEYAKSKGNLIAHYAGTFAAKEAVFKAVNQIISEKIDLVHLEILRNRSGVPHVRFNESLRRKAKNLETKVSISHSGSYALAIAFAKQNQEQA